MIHTSLAQLPRYKVLVLERYTLVLAVLMVMKKAYDMVQVLVLLLMVLEWLKLFDCYLLALGLGMKMVL